MGTLKEIERAEEISRTLHAHVADAVLEDVSHAAVKCRHCGQNFDASREAMARYFKSGWPMCCGETAMLSIHKAGAR